MDDFCNTGLALGLGSSSYSTSTDTSNLYKKLSSPTLGAQDHQNDKAKEKEKTASKLLKFDHHNRDILPSLSLGTPSRTDGAGSSRQLYRQSSSTSPGSSYSNSIGNTNKGERLLRYNSFNRDEVEVDNKSAIAAAAVAGVLQSTSRGGGGQAVSSDQDHDHDHDEDEEASPRKKLRLTKEQSAVLEDSFKEHNTLNPNQKQALAKELNLRPRQVEVWFQNRRARTKLKQTEMDLELLKRCCEKLTEENKRLHKELQELKALKLTAPNLYMHMPAATLITMCPSCERIMNTTSGSASNTSTAPAAPVINSNGGTVTGNGGNTSPSKLITTLSMGQQQQQQQQQQTTTSSVQPQLCNSPFSTNRSSAAC